MKLFATRREALSLLLSATPMAFSLSACPSLGKDSSSDATQATGPELDTSRFVIAIEDEPDTVDFQCTSIYYTVAINVFNRLVETELDEKGEAFVAPSLAESWDVSDDGRNYTFHLRKGVTFTNGSPLTSSDVLYTFNRLLTHPDSCNRDIADPILGANELTNGEANELEGFTIHNDHDFTITLKEAFLACLSMPGASILDEKSVSAAGDLFGKDPEHTIGTGPLRPNTERYPLPTRPSVREQQNAFHSIQNHSDYHWGHPYGNSVRILGKLFHNSDGCRPKVGRDDEPHWQRYAKVPRKVH